jgi:hypothetical protein
MVGAISGLEDKEWVEKGIRMGEDEEGASETVLGFQLHADFV